MEIRKKVGIATAFLIIFTGCMVALQAGGEEWVRGLNPDKITPYTKAGMKASYNWDDCNYGPQQWRPYKEPLNISDSPDDGQNGWYLMYVRANATPYGGNPAIYRRGNVLVNYSFTDLAGTAAFHVIGFDKTQKCRTNRQDGYGASGFFVSGTSEPGEAPPDSSPMRSWNNAEVIPAGNYDNEESLEPYFYFIHFNPLSGGLDALHITDDPVLLKGRTIRTIATSGSFYITHTGGNVIDDLLIVVCVDEIQPETFEIELETSLCGRE